MVHNWIYSELTEVEKEKRRQQQRDYYRKHREELIGKRNQYYKKYRNYKERNFMVVRLIPDWEYAMNLSDIFDYLKKLRFK